MRQRPRRNRKSDGVRRLLRETRVEPADIVAPLFVIEGEGEREEIPSMPGQYRLGPDLPRQKGCFFTG